MKRVAIQFKLPIVFISFLFLVICSSNAYGSRADVEAFVTRFYQECLGRNPGSTSLNNWTNYLLSGEKTGAEVAYGFVFSPEFLDMNTTDEEFLYVLYEAFFNRQPDQGGYDRWLNELSDQTPQVGAKAARKNVLNGFLGAPEFKNLCDEYGITRGTVTYTNPITPPSLSRVGSYTLTDFLILFNDGTRYGPSDFSTWSGTMQVGNKTYYQAITINGETYTTSETYSIIPASGTYDGIIQTTSSAGITYNYYYYTSGNMVVTFEDGNTAGLPYTVLRYWRKTSDSYSILSRIRFSSDDDELDHYNLGAIIGEIIR